jgi:transcriptional regulator with XRE-family HTH domain
MAAPKRLGHIVRELRERRGLSVEMLAERASVARSLLVLLEGGQGAKPSRAILERLARALSVHVDRLIDEP